jgi:hypothetical protein
MTIERSPYLSTIAKKSPWQAVPVDKGQVLDGAEETLFKALALRHLEIPVKVAVGRRNAKGAAIHARHR